jgi:hypothetical protein
MVGYPGNKSNWIPVPGQWRVINDLFAGSLGWAKTHLRKNSRALVYAAEVNPIQRTFLLSDNLSRASYREICDFIVADLKTAIHPEWNGQGTYSELYPVEHANLKTLWNRHVKANFDNGMFREVDRYAIAAQICVSALGYGTNIRQSDNGLNISPNAQKLRTHKNTVIDRRVPTLQSVAADFADMAIVGGERSLSLIDPPYWLPKYMQITHRRCTSCYPGHKPYGAETWQLYIDAIVQSLKAGVHCCAIAGYWSEELDLDIRALAEHFGYDCDEPISHGALATQRNGHKHRKTHGNRSQNAKLRKSKPSLDFMLKLAGSECPTLWESIVMLEYLTGDLPQPIDTEWRLWRRGMERGVDPKQISLFQE